MTNHRRGALHHCAKLDEDRDEVSVNQSQIVSALTTRELRMLAGAALDLAANDARLADLTRLADDLAHGRIELPDEDAPHQPKVIRIPVRQPSLTPEQVEQIKREYRPINRGGRPPNGHKSLSYFAKRYGASYGAVHRAVRGAQ